ncbi:MAG: hypothetical protein AABX85_00475 [Nanoarchaeota archaeon]
METSDFVVLAVGLGLLINFFVVDKVEKSYNEFYNFLLSALARAKVHIISIILSLNNWKVYLVLGLIALPFLSYYNYRLIRYLINRRNQIKSDKEFIELEIKQTKDALTKTIIDLDYHEMRNLIENLQIRIDRSEDYGYLTEFEKPLKLKLESAKRIFEELLHKDNIKNLEMEEEELENMNKELQEEINHKHRLLEEENDDILRDLEIYANPVFKKEVLTDREFRLLLKNGYVQTNQYCVYEKKMISVLVRKVSNHSLTHIFLVWSVKKLLDKQRKIRHIEEHLSVNADITFDYENENFALEIETGTLLGKKKQIDEKIKYLNRKYPNKWMIVVSNKNLLPKYRKMGFATSRTEVAKNLEKLLKMNEN